MERSDRYLVVLLVALAATMSALAMRAGLAVQVALTGLVLAALFGYVAAVSRRRAAVVERYDVDERPEWMREGDAK